MRIPESQTVIKYTLKRQRIQDLNFCGFCGIYIVEKNKTLTITKTEPAAVIFTSRQALLLFLNKVLAGKWILQFFAIHFYILTFSN